MTDTTTRTTGDPSRTQQAKDEAAGVAHTAKDEAANVAATAKDQAADVAQTAAEEARHLADQAGEQARQVLADARDQLMAKADEEAHRLAGTVADLGTQLRTMADAGQEGLARDLIAQAAEGTQRMAQHLREGGLDRTLSDARRMARNRPGTFLLGAAAAGFIAARVARSADTTALKDAATSSGNGNGNGHVGTGAARYGDGVQWSDPDLTLEASQPRPIPSAADASAPRRPLVADPVPQSGMPLKDAP